VKISLIQTDVAFGISNFNIANAIAFYTRESDADLVVFPECFLTGYVCETREEAMDIAIEPERLEPIQAIARAQGNYVIVGYAERCGDKVYNTADLYGPDGLVLRYRKSHLLCLGIDRFTTPGDELPVVETRFGRIGILICYDQRPPEAARTLALKGADLIVLPTNWPDGAETSSRHISRARAAENHVFYACCNRVGTERGTTFFGESKILGPSGETLAEAEAGPTVLRAEVDLSLARNKHVVNRPGEYEYDVFGDRRPELYELGPS